MYQYFLDCKTKKKKKVIIERRGNAIYRIIQGIVLLGDLCKFTLLQVTMYVKLLSIRKTNICEQKWYKFVLSPHDLPYF